MSTFNIISKILSSVDITVFVYSGSRGPGFTWDGINFTLNTTLNTIIGLIDPTIDPYCYTANTTFIPDSRPPGFDTLTAVIIGNLVTNIGAGAFSECTELMAFVILGSLTSIGAGTFSGCTALIEFIILGSLTSIGNNAFSGCTSLSDFIFNSSLISIGDGTFSGCTALTSVKIPTSVTSIGINAFSGASGLHNVTLINGQFGKVSPSTAPVVFYGATSVNIILPEPPSLDDYDPAVILGTTVVGGIIIFGNFGGEDASDTATYPRTYTYQWYRGNNQIGGATSSSYTTVEADIGTANAISCYLVVTNVAGSTEPLKSTNLIIVASSPQLPPQPTPKPPSQFTSLPSVCSITVDGDLNYMYAHYIDINVPGSYIAKIDANNGTIINSQFITSPHIVKLSSDSLISEFISQILVVDNDLYMTFEKYIYIVTDINTNSPGTPSIWFTSNVTTNALLVDLVTDGTYIYTTDTENKCIMRVSLASSGTSSATPWATLGYYPLVMTINNGYMYVTCVDARRSAGDDTGIISYISKINISDPSTPNDTWVTIGSNVEAFGIAIYGSYMYIALNYLALAAQLSLGSYISLIYLSNGEGIIQNPNWVTIPNELLSSDIIGGIKKVIITEKNQNVNLYTCDDIIKIPLAGDTPISNICFPAGTPITTDQGIIAIEKINPNIHTINKKPIVDIIKTIYNDKYLIGFKKNAICKNCPSQFTVMTKNHKIIWQGRKCDAESFLYRYENVGKVKYNGEILYNVLMEEHSEMLVNNMLCETLDPNNTVAKLYKRGSKYTPGDRYKISKFIADSVKNTKFNKYKTYRNIIKNL
jgi:hypothetical protein